jgi:putative transposase
MPNGTGLPQCGDHFEERPALNPEGSQPLTPDSGAARIRGNESRQGVPDPAGVAEDCRLSFDLRRRLADNHKIQAPLSFHKRPAMASTYLSLHYHLIFATKNREARIALPWRARLHEYLGGMVQGLGGFSHEVGGIADHVHLQVSLKSTHCLADFMRELKKSSSEWVHEMIGEQTFRWQEGYAAFTVSSTGRGGVKSYVANQEEHHRQLSSRDELLELLRLAEIEYDPTYFE